MLGNRNVAVIVGILLILVIFYNVQFFMSKNRASNVALQQGNLQQPQKISVPEKVQPVAEKAGEKDIKAAWKRDPFSLSGGADSRTPELTDDIRLAGILKRDGKSYALINGKVYGVNDRIGMAVIKEIRKHSIVILSEGNKQEISFDDYKVIKEKKK